MFENDEKKYLKQKYNKMQGMSRGNQQSVYGELKLSEKLSSELEDIKNHVNGLNERLEEALYQRDSYKIEIDQLQ